MPHGKTCEHARHRGCTRRRSASANRPMRSTRHATQAPRFVESAAFAPAAERSAATCVLVQPDALLKMGRALLDGRRAARSSVRTRSARRRAPRGRACTSSLCRCPRRCPRRRRLRPRSARRRPHAALTARRTRCMTRSSRRRTTRGALVELAHLGLLARPLPGAHGDVHAIPRPAALRTNSVSSADVAPNAMHDSMLSTTNDSWSYHSSVWWRPACQWPSERAILRPASSYPNELRRGRERARMRTQALR